MEWIRSIGEYLKKRPGSRTQTVAADDPYKEVVADFNQFLHQLRTEQIRRMPPGAKTFLSAGCSGTWYFEWIRDNYGSLDRHVGVEFYSPRPSDLMPEIEWIQNTVADMHDVCNKEVDLVFSGQNLEHLWPEEVVGFLLESHRVLKEGGWLIVDSPNRLITAPLGWSHPEHTIEFTPSEARELLDIAGFDSIVIRGVWLCRDPVKKTVLPLPPLASPHEWPYLRRIDSGLNQPDDAFVWWAEARKSERQPNADELATRVKTIFSAAWPERIQRLATQIGTKSRDGKTIRASVGQSGALIFGPYMPLKSGHYEVIFSVRADTARLSPETLICGCDVLSLRRERIAGRDVFAKDVSSGSFVDFAVPFDLDVLEFGMQFRIISSGNSRMEAAYSVQLKELESSE